MAVTLLVVLCGAVPVGLASGANAADAQPGETARAAVGFLLDQQGADGGFGAGAVTPDAVSAIAQDAQSSDTWSAKDAIDAVSAVETPGGRTPLDALDAAANADTSPEEAAVLITRAVVAMGLDPANFDPAANGRPVDLVHRVVAGRGADGSYGSVTATAEAVLALVMVGRGAHDTSVQFLEDAQQRNGGWSTGGSPDGTDVDPATTGLVVQALVAAEVPTTGTTSVTKAISFLARSQGDDGGWPAERGGATDPRATGWAMGAVRAVGEDPDQACWRDSDPPEGEYRAPSTTLAEAQQPDGQIAGGIDPVASTAVGVQGLLGRWLPTTRAPEQSCGGGGGGPSVPPSLVILVVFGLVLVVGAVRIMRSGGG